MNAMHRFPCDVGWAKTGRGGRMSGWDVWEVGDKKMIVISVMIRALNINL